MATVANQLGPVLRQRVVFIGASLLPLMETEDEVFAELRPTDDVDAVIITASYVQKGALDERLRAQGFRHEVSDRTHVDRWRSPSDVIFDCISCGAHLGGTGNPDEFWVINHAVDIDLPPQVRHASAVGLLRLKLSAYADRGALDPLGSKDLSDIATLLATRPPIVEEVQSSEPVVAAALAKRIRALLDTPRALSAIRAHVVERGPLFDGVEFQVIERLETLALAPKTPP
ncbi:MAG: hypothetical protein IPP90_02100 [Gemmatimonadaceae bacterium]|nr:hypothetical protein [Gemmatimonadaceae bacterium]